MIGFIIKGLIRDKSRSLFPVLIVAAGVALTVLLHTWINGIMREMVETNAKFQTGHLKVITRSMLNYQHQKPVDLALTDIHHWLEILHGDYPSVNWQPRLHFGGLLDFPDKNGETIAQGTVFGMAVNLFSKESHEIEYLNLKNALVRGELPVNSGEILISDKFLEKLNMKIGQKATLISGGMYGEMSVYNFKITGTLTFGIEGLDRGTIIADIKDVQNALNMNQAATEIFGYFKANHYLIERAGLIADDFNKKHLDSKDPFSPIMRTLKQGELGQLLVYIDKIIFVTIAVFVFIMGVVLWNLGIMNGIRRYGEIGLRLAMGESRGNLYLSLVYEAFFIGFIGSIIGTCLGLIPSYYLQEEGFDISQMMDGNYGILISNVMRSQITSVTYYIGFIPGLLASSLGSMISGLAIYKRQTAELFKELEI